jgi:hypothetical protein
MDVAYMHEDEAIEKFHEFKNDASGKPLKYKIIVKGCQIHCVLYNSVSNDGTKSLREIPFKEISIMLGAKYINGDLNETKNLDGSPKTFLLADLSHVPTGILASADQNKVQNYDPLKL